MIEVERNVPKTFAEQLRKVREATGLSLRAVASKAGISSTFLSDVELGRRMPSREIMQKLADALMVPLEELLRYDPRENVTDVVALMEAQPEVAALLARIGKRLKVGKVRLHQLERLAG